MSNTMSSSYTIHPLTLPDIPEATQTSQLAFASHNTLIYTSPLSPTSLENLISTRMASFPTETDVYSFKAVDTVSNKIIGSSRWSLHLEDEVDERSVEEVVEARMRNNFPEMRRDVTRNMYAAITRGSRAVLSVPASDASSSSASGYDVDGEGKGCVLSRRLELEGLFVHPDYQRRGIARALMQWGIEEADRLGLEIYLDATAAGRPFYTTCGFETRKVVPVEGVEFAVSYCQWEIV
ncbi:acyl-CoA N-acyltransferase [Aspergillus crustosus]